MSLKSPREYHGQWLNVSDPTELPNVSGATIQDAALEVGDTCYSISDTMLYFCTTATVGSAVWASGGGGGGAGSYPDFAVGYQYTQASPPVEEVCGDGYFDGGLVGTLTAYFRATIINNFVATGIGEMTRVRLYDMGPKAGPPGTPRLVTELTSSTDGGPQVLEQALTVVAAAPTTNEILDSSRMYEVTIEQDVSTVGDTCFVGSSGLDAR